MCIAMVLVACGSDSLSDSTGASTPQPASVEGIVFTEQGPTPNVLVVVKNYDGQLLGQAITDASGAYVIPTLSIGPYIAQAKNLKTGIVLYGISQNSIMNITHVNDFMIQRWYEALSFNPNQAFNYLDVNTPVPDEPAMSAVIDQIFYPIAKAFRVDSLYLFRDDISVIFAKALRATTIAGNTISINMTEPFVRSSIQVQARADDQGEVIFSGQSVFDTAMSAPLNFKVVRLHFWEAEYSFSGFWSNFQAMIAGLSKAISPISSANAAPISSNIEGIVPNAKRTQTNERWMSDIWTSIKDRKLAEVIIPGTHDSGTYQLGWGSGINSAKTQNVSIGEQLKDGIRYLDLRVTEASHTGCADDSVWWLFHTWKSYRLQDALDEIAAFIKKPANSKEVIILDFQDIAIKYDDVRAIDVLLALVHKKLGPHIAPTDQASNWHNSTLANFVGQGRQIIVLVPTSTSTRINAPGFAPGCAAKFDTKFFAPRGGNLRSFYAELEDSQDIQERVITPQLQRGSPLGDDLFNAYRTQQNKGLLNVIQIVPRPSNSWYVIAVAQTAWGYPYDLLTYASHRINAPLNLKISKADVYGLSGIVAQSLVNPLAIGSSPLANYCASGWLGKRLLMGVRGNPINWNMPNIIIVDNYNPNVKAAQFNWVLPKHTNGSWVKDWQGGYVDFVIKLNKLNRDNALNGLTNFSDAQCLS
jgi:hypothetical protein